LSYQIPPTGSGRRAAPVDTGAVPGPRTGARRRRAAPPSADARPRAPPPGRGRDGGGQVTARACGETAPTGLRREHAARRAPGAGGTRPDWGTLPASAAGDV